MYEDPTNEELMAVDGRLRTDADRWRTRPPEDLHQRTMAAIAAARGEATAGTAAGGAARWGGPADSALSGRIGRVPHGMALAAASLALLITTWAALVLQSPPAPIEPEMEGGSGAMVRAPGGTEPGEGAPEAPIAPTDPLADLLAQASLESEMAALETDARTISAMMTRQVRLIGSERR